ncbi:MAG: 4Fe-4S binding protein [Desulfobacterales bacterium]|nr:4Fe-4S binding protein [Desulfobacterales bacterium]
MVLGFWALLPYLFSLSEPAIGFFSGKAKWGQGLHVPMTLTFFLSLLLVLLFGRRAVCSWNCTCVGSRDTMGAAFRKETIKSDTAWKFRHLKWVLTSFYFALFVIVLLPFPKATLFVDAFFGMVGVIYFASFLFIPLTGNRNWCRWLCPYGQTFGILNKVGFYKIKADKGKCISCGKCTKECDMGIPVQHLVDTRGEVNVPDCVGCGRCITNCPKEALKFVDIRSFLKRTLGSVEALQMDKADSKRKTFKVIKAMSTENKGNNSSEMTPVDKDQLTNSQTEPRAEYTTAEYLKSVWPKAPAIMVGDEIVVQGADFSEEKLESAICRHLGLKAKEGLVSRLLK